MPVGQRDNVTLEEEEEESVAERMGFASETHCCIATAKHIRGNKMGKQCYSKFSFTLKIGIFQGGNGVDTAAFQGVDDKYGCQHRCLSLRKKSSIQPASKMKANARSSFVAAENSTMTQSGMSLTNDYQIDYCSFTKTRGEASRLAATADHPPHATASPHTRASPHTTASPTPLHPTTAELPTTPELPTTAADVFWCFLEGGKVAGQWLFSAMWLADNSAAIFWCVIAGNLHELMTAVQRWAGNAPPCFSASLRCLTQPS